jgi:hypothetical protein
VFTAVAWLRNALGGTAFVQAVVKHRYRLASANAGFCRRTALT